VTAPTQPPDDGDEPPPGQGWRRSAKALLLDTEGRLLLLQMCDPLDPARGEWWELPGGGVEAGETDEQACAREIAEETGHVVPVSAVGPARWRRTATFTWLGRRHWSWETVHVVHLPEGAATAPATLTDAETGSQLTLCWWTLADIAASNAVFYPGRLGELAAQVLAGGRVEEGFERWN
jgi:8-oxo-dGTP pyrophosphatase MutT (NUDIX family)